MVVHITLVFFVVLTFRLFKFTFFEKLTLVIKGNPSVSSYIVIPINGWNQITINGKFKQTSLRKSNFISVPTDDILV